MRKFFLLTFIILIFSFVYAELYEIRIDRSDVYAKEILSNLDILSADIEEISTIVYIVDAVPHDLILLDGTAEIKKITKDITILPYYSDLDSVNGRISKVVETSMGYAKVFDIGRSVEGRNIKAVRVSKVENDNRDMPEILFVGLHHAREWISSEVTLGILEFLVYNIDSNPFISDILENSVVWFVPMLNPDGYVFSWEEARMWRYNRRPHPDGTIGVDLNRNYDSSWIKIDYVHGEEPFSEPETQAIKNLILNDFKEPLTDGIKSLDGLITYHSYGQIIMYPPGSTEEPA